LCVSLRKIFLWSCLLQYSCGCWKYKGRRTRDRCYDFNKYFRQNNLLKIWRFLFKLLLGFEKNANFSAKNWRKSQKIVITTSTQGL
jgi:hypothetical protein